MHDRAADAAHRAAAGIRMAQNQRIERDKEAEAAGTYIPPPKKKVDVDEGAVQRGVRWDDRADFAHCAEAIATALKSRGDVDGAVELFGVALAIFWRLNGEEDEDVLIIGRKLWGLLQPEKGAYTVSESRSDDTDERNDGDVAIYGLSDDNTAVCNDTHYISGGTDGEGSIKDENHRSNDITCDRHDQIPPTDRDLHGPGWGLRPGDPFLEFERRQCVDFL